MTTSIIKQLREGRSFSQDELASLLDISRPSLKKIEEGKKDLSLSQIKMVSSIFEVPVEAIIENKIIRREVNILPSEKKIVKKEDMRIDIPQENVDKFKEVFLYVLEKVGAKPNVGQTVLYKLLYFIDFDFYEKHEEQLMGNVYIKNHFGPTPVAFSRIVQDMEDAGELEEVKSKFFGREQTKYLPVREPNIKNLSAEEIKHIDEVLDKYSDWNGRQLSDYSHKDVPWLVAEDGKELSYESVFYRTEETSVRVYED